MNKTLRKVILIATVVLVSVACAIPVYAAKSYKDFMKNAGRIDGVDYTRIKTGQATQYPITLQIGEVQCWTVIKEGERLSKEEQDKIIKQIMLEMGLTEDKLALYEYTRWQASKSTPGFDSARLIAISKKIMAGAMSGAIPPGVEAYAEYTGGKDGYEIAHDYITGKANESTVVGEALPGIYGVVGSALLSAGDEALAGIADEIRHNQLLQKALEYDALLNLFYNKCNLAIEAREVAQAEYAEKPRISCHKTVIKTATVFGVEVPQTWKIDIEMERKHNPEPEGPGGLYKGTVSINISHNLSKLVAQFKKKVILGPGSPFLVVPESTNKIVEKKMGTWILTKSLTADNAVLQIYDEVAKNTGKEVGKMNIDKTFKEEDKWNLLCKVNIIPTVGIKVDDEGKWDKGAISGNHGTKIFVYNTMREVNGRRYPALKNYSETTFADSTDKFSGKVFGGTVHEMGQSEPWVVDHQVYKDLKKNCMTVEGGWKGYDKVFGK